MPDNMKSPSLSLLAYHVLNFESCKLLLAPQQIILSSIFGGAGVGGPVVLVAPDRCSCLAISAAALVAFLLPGRSTPLCLDSISMRQRLCIDTFLLSEAEQATRCCSCHCSSAVALCAKRVSVVCYSLARLWLLVMAARNLHEAR